MYARTKKVLSPLQKIKFSKMSISEFGRRFAKQLKYYRHSKFAQDAIKARYGIPVRG